MPCGQLAHRIPSPRLALPVALVAGLFLAGCASGVELSTKAITTAEMKDDKFRPYREVVTPGVRTGGGGNLMDLQLAARIDRKSGQVTTLLRVDMAYAASGRRQYESARSSRAEALGFEVVVRSSKCQAFKADSCVYREHFLVSIPEADLKAAPAGGYPLKVFARSGPEMVVTIPRGSIDALVQAIEADPMRVAAAGVATSPPTHTTTAAVPARK